MSCPYCKKPHFIPNYVWTNVESYGDKWVHFPCNNCGKIIEAFGKRTVLFDQFSKTDNKSDW